MIDIFSSNKKDSTLMTSPSKRGVQPKYWKTSGCGGKTTLHNNAMANIFFIKPTLLNSADRTHYNTSHILLFIFYDPIINVGNIMTKLYDIF